MFHYNLFSLLRCPADASQDQRLQCCYYSPDEKNHDGEVWYLAAGVVPFFCLPIVLAEEVWGLSADLLWLCAVGLASYADSILQRMGHIGY
jgi:hypothetical protein